MRWFLCYPNVYEVQGVRIIRGEWRRVGYTGGVRPTKFGVKRICCKLGAIEQHTPKGTIHEVTLAFLRNAVSAKL